MGISTILEKEAKFYLGGMQPRKYEKTMTEFMGNCWDKEEIKIQQDSSFSNIKYSLAKV